MLFRPCIRERERVLTVYTIAACDVQSSSAIIVTVTTTATPTGIIIIVTIMFVLIIDEFLWRMRISRKLSVLFKIVQVAVIHRIVELILICLSSTILHVIRIRVILGDIQVPFSIYSLPTPASSVFLYFIPVCSVPVKHLRLLRIPGVLLLLLLLRLFLMMVLLLKCFMKQMMLVSLQLLLQLLLLLPYRLLSL